MAASHENLATPQAISGGSSRPSMPLSRLALIMLLAGSLTWFTRGYWLPAIGLSHESPRGRDQAYRSPLRIDPKFLDLGEVTETRRLLHRVEIENTTAQPVTIERFEMSCDCVGFKPKRLELPAHGKGSIELTLDLSRPPAVIHSAESWEHRVAIRAYGHETANDSLIGRWLLRGRVKSALMAEPGMVSFDDLTRGVQGPQMTVVLRPRIPADRLSLGKFPQWLRCSIAKVEDRFELKVTAKPMHEAGEFKGDIDIDLVGSDGRAVSFQSLKARANVAELVLALPAAVNLGVVPVGSIVTQAISIQGRVPGSLKFIAVDAGKGTTCTLDSHGTRGLVRMKQEVASAGPGSSSIFVKTRFEGEMIAIRVAVAWYGERTLDRP